MVEEREALTLLLGSFVLLFIAWNRTAIVQIPASRYLMAAFGFIFASLAFSVAEDLLWKDLLNFLQHLCSGIGGVLMAAWCWFVATERTESSP